MRKPVLLPSGGPIANLIRQYLLGKEAVTIVIDKIPTRLKRVTVEVTGPEWKEFIQTEVTV